VDAALSREGLFVANNVLFVGFAIVVLAGTIFPLLYEAVNGGQVTVGTPYFAKVAAPASLVLLVLMAIAPLAGWRRADPKVLWERLRPVAWSALLVVAVLRLAGIAKPLLLGAYFLAALAAGAAGRTLLGSLRAARQRGDGAWRALLGPSAGGMVVHVGVGLLALGVVSSTSLATRTEVTLAMGQSTFVAGQKLTYLGMRTSHTPLRDRTTLLVQVDGHGPYRPAITTFQSRGAVGTPAIASNLARDVYVTFDAVGGNGTTSGAQIATNLPAGSVVLGVTVEPMLVWLWIGGLTVGAGSALAFFRRREPRP
jgi:cytochrome c-type biogenesis protein CcmF